MERELIVRLADELAKQCDTCKLGGKAIGKRSGCDIRRQLVINKSELSWERSEVFLESDGSCKLYSPKYEMGV